MTTAKSYPLTVAQSEFQFGEALRPGSGNMVGVVQSMGHVDRGLAATAVQALIERHEALRTRFRRRAGRAAQVIEPNTRLRAVEIASMDARRHPPSDLGSAVDAFVAEQFDGPFDLSAAPILRLLLVRRPDYTTTVGLVTNHIVADNWAMKILWRELFALYQDLATARSLPTSDATMASLALWEEEQRRTDGFAPLRDRVHDALNGSRCPANAGPARSGETATIQLEFDSDQRAWLDAARRRAGTTQFAVALALFARALGRHVAEDDIIVFVPVSNRDATNWYSVGLFANTVPVRVVGGTSGPLGDAIERARELLTGAIAVGRWPLGLLARSLDSRTRQDVFAADRLRATVREIAADAQRTIRPTPASARRARGSGIGGQNPGLPMDLLLEVGTSTWSLTYDVASIGPALARRLLDMVVAELGADGRRAAATA